MNNFLLYASFIIIGIYLQFERFKNSFYKFQVIQMNKLPLVVSFIASHNCNTGHILSLENKIDPILCSLKNAVVEA